MRYQNGKCLNQPVGKNTFGSIPCKIAKFLNLENPEKYTGHSFRRTSATLLANTGVEVLTLKRHGGWKSANIAESYVAESLSNKNIVADKILYNKTSTITSSSLSVPSNASSTITETLPERNLVIEGGLDSSNNINVGADRDRVLPNFVNNVSNCSNCTININFR